MKFTVISSFKLSSTEKYDGIEFLIRYSEAMPQYGYSWRNARHTSSYLLPRSEHLGRWVLAAVILGVVFHFILFLALEKVPVIVQLLGGSPQKVSPPAKIQMTSLPPRELRDVPKNDKIMSEPEELLKVSEQIAALEDVMEEAIITPEISENLVDFKIEAPAISGAQFKDSLDWLPVPEMKLDAPDLGQDEELLTNLLKADIQMDPGDSIADAFDPDLHLQSLLKEGAQGLSLDGVMENFTTLENMKMLSGNALENAKAMIGSDLLFEFGKAELKSHARNSLMAVAYLIDKNPEMFCVLNGHTDLFGSELRNRELSLKRAEAVKAWLVRSLLLDESRIIVVPHGMTKPIVKEGDRRAQALNRRVVIEMKKMAPKMDVLEDRPTPKAPVPEEEEIPRAIPRALEVIPRGIPVS